MGRRVVTTRLQSTGQSHVDGYFDKVVKYIPADIVAAWVAVTGIVDSSKDKIDEEMVLRLTFGAGVLLTCAWTWKQTTEQDQPVAWKQIIISTIAFIVWVIALGGEPFNIERGIGAILLIGFTLVVGLFEPK